MTDTASKPAEQALAEALRRPRYEILPLAGAAEQVAQHVPSDLPVTVTASPPRGLEPTLAVTERLARHGFEAVPHLAARQVLDEAHLSDVLQRVDEAGVRDVFVVAGDGEQPAGEFSDSVELLTAIHRLRLEDPSHGLDRVGIAGYPEGHPFIGEAELASAMLAKQSVATYIVSQMCFDDRVLSAWVAKTRRLGVDLPVHVGVAGMVDRRKLLRTVGRIGIGQSARFLRKNSRGLARILLPGAYRPDRLVRKVAADMAVPARGVTGLHIYTLGDVAATEKWRRQMLARVAPVRDEN